MSLAPALSQKQITSQVLRKMRRELPVEMIEMILSFVDYSVKFLEPTSLLYKLKMPYQYYRADADLSIQKFRVLKNTTANKETKQRLYDEFCDKGKEKSWYMLWARNKYINNDVPRWFKDVEVGQTFNSQVYQKDYDFHQYSYVVAKKNKKSFKIDQFICEWKKENNYKMTKQKINIHTINKIAPEWLKTDLGFEERKLTDDDDWRPSKMPRFAPGVKLVKDSLAGFLNREIWYSNDYGKYQERYVYEERKMTQAVKDDNKFVLGLYEVAEVAEAQKENGWCESPVIFLKLKHTYKLGDEHLKPKARAHILLKPRDFNENPYFDENFYYEDEEEEEILDTLGKGKW